MPRGKASQEKTPSAFSSFSQIVQNGAAMLTPLRLVLRWADHSEIARAALQGALAPLFPSKGMLVLAYLPRPFSDKRLAYAEARVTRFGSRR